MSVVLNRHVDRKKNPEDELPGFIGKICVLGLGYNMGWPKLAENFLKGAMNGPPVKFGWDMAEQLGANVADFMGDAWKMEKLEKMITRVSKEDLVVHCAVTEVIVKKWRELNKPIVQLWKTMENVLEAMLEDEADYTFGPNECLRVVRHAIVLPNGLKLRYPGLRDVDGYSYLGGYGKQRQYIYGGKLTENVVQALARIIVTDQMLHIKATTGEDPALFTHDELAYLIPDARARAFCDYLHQTMKVAPAWAAGLPLAVESGAHQSYGLCK
jgi:DNA polymerase